jgi:putative MATE family efflux protein
MFFKHRLQSLFNLYRDRQYFKELFKLAFPMAVQNFIMSFLNMVGVMIIGQLGGAAIAAVSLANQIFFLLTLLLFGITSGAAMFTAQLWGKRDLTNIRKVLGLCLFLGLTAGILFWLLARFFSAFALGVYSQDPAVVAAGSQYLQVIGWAFPVTAITTSYAAILRSIGDIKAPLMVNIAALLLNLILSFCLVFGYLGFPQLGIQGAAVAVLVARLLECVGLLWLTYGRRSPVAAGLKELLQVDFSFMGKVLKPILPVALNEVLWSTGVTMYNIIYAHLGTDAIAAMNIAASIDGLAMVIFISISNACAILVGNWIGANEEEQAFRYATRSLGIQLAGALLIGGIILIGAKYILVFYKVSPAIIHDTTNVLTVIGLFYWLRMMNMTLYVGIMRSGGDTRFGLLLDGGTIWVVGVPMALMAAFLFHLPVYWVYLLAMSDEASKWVIGLFRFFSKKWIHNLTQTI